ncbi:MAG: Ribosome maturation factor RimP [Cryomorphaceae bacterium]|jgi:ribosome maturation factor RimP|nr:MAG: Ribosome maturation factor RimP [Cryomorphaceae bacterium]
MEYAKVREAAELAASENGAFLVDVELKPNNVIVAYVDADEGLNIDQIKMINRMIEGEFDREVEDFNLTVSSPDLNLPLRIFRQYQKNVGRFLKVKYNDQEVEGQLLEADPEFLVLSVPQKKKSAPNIELKINFSEITEAKVAIRFK